MTVLESSKVMFSERIMKSGLPVDDSVIAHGMPCAHRWVVEIGPTRNDEDVIDRDVGQRAAATLQSFAHGCAERIALRHRLVPQMQAQARVANVSVRAHGRVAYP